MARIFIYGNPNSPLVSWRGLIALQGGHSVDWFWAKPFFIPGVRTHAMPRILAASTLIRVLLEPFFLARALAFSKPDIVHVHYASRLLSVLPLIAQAPLVVTVMGSDVSPVVAYKGLAKFFINKLLDSATAITSKSNQMDQMILAIGDYKEKIERITWGTDLDLFTGDHETEALHREYMLPEGSLMFFDPRAAKPLYNKELILRAFRDYVSGGGKPAVLLISQFNADLAYLESLKRLVYKWDLEPTVRFLEPADSVRMAQYYSLADVVISVPSSDGFPQTIYEAWASGCFLILADLPQYSEAVRLGKAALVVPPNESAGLTQAMHQIANLPELRQVNLKVARDYVRRHADQAEQSQRLLDLYSKLLRS